MCWMLDLPAFDAVLIEQHRVVWCISASEVFTLDTGRALFSVRCLVMLAKFTCTRRRHCRHWMLVLGILNVITKVDLVFYF